MEAPPCKVIGCMDRGCWRLQCPAGPYSEDYLCHTHWEMLLARNPRRADCYIAFTLHHNSGIGADTRSGLSTIVCESPYDSAIVAADLIGRSEQQARQQQREQKE
jgi:hypothetical protein